MASWRSQYLSALVERDKQEKAGQDIFNACWNPLRTPDVKTTDLEFLDNKLADKAATLEATSSITNAAVEGVSASPPQAKGRTTSTADSPSSTPAQAEALARLRLDLSEAQRTKEEQQSRLKSVTEELERLKLKSKMDTQRISELAMEKAGLVTKMRDRDEELREKAKLLEVLRILSTTLPITILISMCRRMFMMRLCH